jgi:hypothetical protein
MSEQRIIWDEDEYHWRYGEVYCVPPDMFSQGPKGIGPQSINEPPHEDCPYILEHLMAEQASR